MEHEKIEMGSNPGRDETPLSRQLTVNLTPEQYERLFFQPSAPRNGDFAKRFCTLAPPCLLLVRHED